MKEQCCKNCKHSRWVTNSRGRRLIQNYLGHCDCPVPSLPASFGFDPLRHSALMRGRVTGDFGTTCPTYEERD